MVRSIASWSLAFLGIAGGEACAQETPSIGGESAGAWLAKYKAADDAGRQALFFAAMERSNGGFDETMVPLLLNWLDAPDVATRLAACDLWIITADPDHAAPAPLVRHLDDAAPLVSVKSAYALYKLTGQPEPSITTFRRHEKSEDVFVRRVAVQNLAWAISVDPTLIELILSHVHDADASIRKHALWGLRDAEKDERSLPAIRDAMEDPDESVRVEAAFLVIYGGDASDQAVSILVGAVHHADTGVRMRVVSGLGALPVERASEAIPTLIAALGDADAMNRRAAANALSSFGQQGVDVPDAQAPLLALLDDPDVYVRAAAADALGHVGADAAKVVPALARHLADADFDTRYNAAKSLAQAGAEVMVALPRLIETLKDPNATMRVSMAQLIALGGAEAKGATTPLTERIADPDADVRTWSIYALRSIGGAAIAALPKLEAALASDPEPKVRVEAARAIAAFGPLAGAAAEPLIAATRDPDGQVRLWSLFALGEIAVKTDVVLATLRAAARVDDAGIAAEANKALAKLGEEHDERAIANAPVAAPPGEPIATPITYAQDLLVMSDANGAALIEFFDPEWWRKGDVERRAVHYRFRYVAKGQQQPTAGEGELRDDWIFSSATNNANHPRNSELRAGPLHVAWTARGESLGGVFWRPEQLHVEVVDVGWLEVVDLRRFIR